MRQGFCRLSERRGLLLGLLMLGLLLGLMQGLLMWLGEWHGLGLLLWLGEWPGLGLEKQEVSKEGSVWSFGLGLGCHWWKVQTRNLGRHCRD